VSTSRRSTLVALGSAAVLLVYTAGYAKTKPAADRLASQSANRRSRGAERSSEEVSSAERGATALGAAPVGGAAPPTAAIPGQPIPASVEGSGEPIADVGPTVTPALPPAPEVPAGAPPVTVPEPVAVVSAPSSLPAPSALAVAPAATPSAPPPPAAPAPAVSAAPPPAAPAATKGAVSYKDGVYLGRGTSRHGDIEAMVEISGGRITNTVISQCLTRYSCSWIAILVPQVVARQSAEVDYVSGATVSSDAFYYAVMQALAQAK
jgi:uncharacterized protein with FMN-binding domain